MFAEISKKSLWLETLGNSTAHLREQRDARLTTTVRWDGDKRRRMTRSVSIAAKHRTMGEHILKPTNAGAEEHGSSVVDDGAKLFNPRMTDQRPRSTIDGYSRLQSPFTVSSCSTPDLPYQSGSSPAFRASILPQNSFEQLGVQAGPPLGDSSRKRRRSVVTVHIISSDTTMPSEPPSRHATPKLEHAVIAPVNTRHTEMRSLSPSSSLTNLSGASQTPSLSPTCKQRRRFASAGGDRTIVISSSQDEDNLEDEAAFVAEEIPLDENAVVLHNKPNGTICKDKGVISKKATTSPEESDIANDDSDSSIDDLITMRRKKYPIYSRETRATYSQGRSSDLKGLCGPQESAFTMTPTPKYKFSLSTLANQNKRDSNAQAEIAKAKAALQAPDVEMLAQSVHIMRDDGNDATISQKNLLASVVHDDEGENRVGRLLQAVSRTEMLKTETAWYFFGEPRRTLDTEVCEFPILDSQPSGCLSDFKGTCHP